MKLFLLVAVILAFTAVCYGDGNPCEDEPVALRSICKAAQDKVYYKKDTNECLPFVYGGCGANENIFSTIEDCEKQCVTPKTNPCDAEPVALRSICKAAKPRVYYKKDTNECLRFTYGGCGANENIFSSIEDCEKQCLKP